MMKPRGGSKRARKYWQRVRKNPKACPGGDCLCDMHEGITAYRNSRVFRNRDLPDLEDEYMEYLSNVVFYPDGTSRLDYAYDCQL